MERTQQSYNIDKTILYLDEPMSKKVDSQGNLIHLKNSDALSQAVKLWLTSGVGEKLRSNTGGPLIPHLGKAITNDRREKIKKDIMKGFNSDFVPSMTITNLNIVADNKKNRWVIQIEGYSKSLELGINTYLVVNNGV